MSEPRKRKRKLTVEQERQEHVWRRNAMLQARSPEEAESYVQAWREQRERARNYDAEKVEKP